MQRKEVNEYLMSNGLSPFTALDRSNKSDIVAYVMNWNIETKTPLKIKNMNFKLNDKVYALEIDLNQFMQIRD